MLITDVLVAGAGPTGLALAVDLARRGVDVRIIDQAPAHFAGSRGKGLQQRSLEVLADLGVGDAVAAAGWTPPTRVTVRGGPVRESPPGDALILPQSIVEAILRDRLAELGVTVEFDTALIGLAQAADHVVASTSRGDVAARYLVGCDGGRSTVRKTLGVPFEGESSDATSVVLGDVEVRGLSRECGHLFIDPARGMLALTPFRAVPQWQLVAAAPDVGEPSAAEFRRQIDLFTGLSDVTIGEPTWMSTYRVNVRMTRQFRVDRVFLAGDAAHVHPPAGGLGMNTGIQDAYNLGWKLARTLAGTASPTLLDTYQQERVPIAEWTLETSRSGLGSMWSSVTNGEGSLDAVRRPEHRQLELGYRGGPLSRDLVPWDGPRAGDRAPWLAEIGGGGFTVLGFGAAAEALDALHGATVRPMPGDQDVLVLVRPDGYVGMVAGSGDVQQVQDYLDRP
ncbi:FAD-dependent monooxygenase [Pseudonocardia sp. CA-107938]|uniref:FAD-dependent monooxygenase n=1 Tax=Pseudonocardia sp. CA-107938 TaxID=3240021 RepID=UPI003D9232CB